MINICLQLNCDSSSKGKRNGKSQTERVQVISAFDLTVMCQQMDLKLSILSRRHLDCPSVFALLMFEVQLDVTMNHDLSEREGRCEVAGWKVMSVVEATEVSASYWHFTGAKYPLLCSATPCPRPCFVLEDFLFLDFQVFTAVHLHRPGLLTSMQAPWSWLFLTAVTKTIKTNLLYPACELNHSIMQTGKHGGRTVSGVCFHLLWMLECCVQTPVEFNISTFQHKSTFVSSD